MTVLTARVALAALMLAGAMPVAGCGRGSSSSGTSAAGSTSAPAATTGAPAAGGTAPAPAPTTARQGGFPIAATKNTTRIDAGDPVQVAADVARAVFPGLTAASRPQAVVLVDRRDWRAATAAAVLESAPLRAALLLADGPRALPRASAAALAALKPTGAKAAGGAQLIRVGDVPRPAGLKSTDVAGGDPFALAAAVDATVSAARGRTGDRVLVAPADDPAYAAPAAAWAAKSGDSVLFTRRGRLPGATRAALARHQQPRIYVLGPPKAVAPAVLTELRKLGTVTRIGAETPATSAIAFASFAESGFGWGVVDPGHGLVFARADADPATPAAAAALSASGSYGPLLLTEQAKAVGAALTTYLRSIQPGYRTDPVRGVYNHGWLIGDTRAISPTTQAQLDSLLEIMPVDTAKP